MKKLGSLAGWSMRLASEPLAPRDLVQRQLSVAAGLVKSRDSVQVDFPERCLSERGTERALQQLLGDDHPRGRVLQQVLQALGVVAQSRTRLVVEDRSDTGSPGGWHIGAQLVCAVTVEGVDARGRASSGEQEARRLG